MPITTILFDLDGTLLPMDQDTFAKAYVKGLTVAAEPAGYSPMILGTAIMAGTAAMVKNNGEKTNELSSPASPPRSNHYGKEKTAQIYL